MKRKIIGLVLVFISILLSLVNVFSVKITGGIIGVNIESSILTILTFVFFFGGLLFLSSLEKKLAALAIVGVTAYAGYKLHTSPKDYELVNKLQIESVNVTSLDVNKSGKFQRTYRYDVILDIIEGKYKIPKGILKGLAMRESYGDPLRLNERSDGGAGLFMFSPGTASAYGLKVYGYSKKTGIDKKHGKELRELAKKYRNDYSKLSKIDDRFDVEKSADAAGRFLIDLYKRYNSWDKALSAYNRGHPAPNPEETNHVKAVKEYQKYYNEKDKKDYYKLYKKGKIKNIRL